MYSNWEEKLSVMNELDLFRSFIFACMILDG